MGTVAHHYSAIHVLFSVVLWLCWHASKNNHFCVCPTKITCQNRHWSQCILFPLRTQESPDRVIVAAAPCRGIPPLCVYYCSSLIPPQPPLSMNSIRSQCCRQTKGNAATTIHYQVQRGQSLGFPHEWNSPAMSPSI